MNLDIARQNYRRITFRYALGLFLFAVAIIGEQYVSHQIVDSEKHDAYVLNISGKQRALSQRIVSMSQQLISGDGSFLSMEFASKEQLVEGLNAAIEQMRHTHHILSRGDESIGLSAPDDPRLKELYFREYGSVEEQVKYFTSLASHVAEMAVYDENTRNSLVMMILLRDSLLVALDDVVTTNVVIASEKLAMLRSIQTAHIVAIALLLVFEILFIFQPMARRVRSAMEELMAQKNKVAQSLNREKEIASFAENSPDPVIRVSDDEQITYSNPASAIIMQALTAREINLLDFLKKPIPEFLEDDNVMSSSITVGATNFVCIAVPYNDHSFVNLYFRDVSELKQAEQKVLKSQRMEAIGQLTGGVAHDFNNLLMVITGSLQLSLTHLKKETPNFETAFKLIESALSAVGRSAEMTKNLLAFSRRQPLRPAPLDVAEAVSSFLPLLKNASGGSATLVFNDHLTEKKHVLLDQGQLESAILNLVINARDAMTNGGDVHIETRPFRVTPLKAAQFEDLAPGDYVVISVTDEGHGIPENVRDRIMEPFFTTKGVGEGTGLGLSMVWGFVKQSGGHLTVYSEEGIGTTVRMFFPVANTSEKAPEPKASSDIKLPVAGSTVLVVEDNAELVVSITNILKAMDYKAVVAHSGDAALDILSRRSDIALVLSDAVMPGGMTGIELSDQIHATHANVPVLLITGFPTGSVAVVRGRRVLSKPFTREDLAREVNLLMSDLAA